MDTPVKHKTIKHYNAPKVSHELTWSCYQSRHLLSTPERRTLVMEAIQRATARLGYATLAFVIMPNHVHLLARHMDEHDISQLLYAIKRPSSFHLKQMMPDGEVASLTIRERPGKAAFRFWQEGPGYDRNIERDTLWASIRYIHRNPVRAGLATKAPEWEWSSARWYAQHALHPNGGIDWHKLPF